MDQDWGALLQHSYFFENPLIEFVRNFLGSLMVRLVTLENKFLPHIKRSRAFFFSERLFSRLKSTHSITKEKVMHTDIFQNM